MTRMGNGRLWICMVLVLVMAVLAAGSAQAGLFDFFRRGKSKADNTPKEFLLVFPFDQVVVSNVPQTFGEDVAGTLKGLLTEDSGYSTFMYTDRLSPVKRENLRTEDATAPFCEDRSKPEKLAKLLATDYYLIGEVQEVQVDQAKKASQVTLSADLYTIKNGESKLLKTFLVTGQSPQDTKATDVDELRALAAGDAVSKLASDILKSPEPAKDEATIADGAEAARSEQQ